MPQEHNPRLLAAALWLLLLFGAVVPAASRATAPGREWVYVYNGSQDSNIVLSPRLGTMAHPRSPYLARPGEFFFVAVRYQNAIILETPEGYLTRRVDYNEGEWAKRGWKLIPTSDYAPAKKARQELNTQFRAIHDIKASQDTEENQALLRGIFAVGGIALLAAGVLTVRRESLEQRKAREAERIARELLRQREWEHAASEKAALETLLTRALDRIREVPGLVALAERQLELAGRYFAERAYLPFWNALEKATRSLAEYDGLIRWLNASASEYRRRAELLRNPVPPFSLPLGQLPESHLATVRLEKLLRSAERDYQFTRVYQNRETNQILIEGFGTLASAIYGMSQSISDGLSELAENLDAATSELKRAMNQNSEALQASLAEQTGLLKEQNIQIAEDARERGKQTEMLNNLQRGRRPLI